MDLGNPLTHTFLCQDNISISQRTIVAENVKVGQASHWPCVRDGLHHLCAQRTNSGRPTVCIWSICTIWCP